MSTVKGAYPAFTVLVVSSILIALVNQQIIKPPATIAATKPYGSFEEFYPFYLSEHSAPNTKRLHFAGTVTLFALLARTPELGLALMAAGAAGLAAFPFMRWLATGLPEFALMLGTYIFLGRRISGSLGKTLAIPISAYFFAWLGHFLVEHNRPATFIYPIFSLMGDLRMAADMARGVIPW